MRRKYNIVYITTVCGIYNGTPWTGTRLVAVRLDDDGNHVGVDVLKAVSDIQAPAPDAVVSLLYDEYGRVVGYDIM